LNLLVRVDACFVTASQKEKKHPEQRYAIKFCVSLGEGATNTYGKIKKTFGNDSVSRAQVVRWHKDFVNGRETVEDEP
jgi:hypothetical protein